MKHIERRAELCPEPGGLQPCMNCGSTAAIVHTDAGRVTRVQRICCDAVRYWGSAAAAAHFQTHGVDLADTRSRALRIAGASRG